MTPSTESASKMRPLHQKMHTRPARRKCDPFVRKCTPDPCGASKMQPLRQKVRRKCDPFVNKCPPSSLLQWASTLATSPTCSTSMRDTQEKDALESREAPRGALRGHCSRAACVGRGRGSSASASDGQFSEGLDAPRGSSSRAQSRSSRASAVCLSICESDSASLAAARASR